MVIAGWVILGALFMSAVFLAFWNEIKEWLNNTAANAVERLLGYNARQNMQKAVCRADKVVNRIRAAATVFVKKPGNQYIDKVSLEMSAPAYEIDDRVTRKIEQEGHLIQEFGYQG